MVSRKSGMWKAVIVLQVARWVVVAFALLGFIIWQVSKYHYPAVESICRLNAILIFCFVAIAWLVFTEMIIWFKRSVLRDDRSFYLHGKFLGMVPVVEDESVYMEQVLPYLKQEFGANLQNCYGLFAPPVGAIIVVENAIEIPDGMQRNEPFHLAPGRYEIGNFQSEMGIGSRLIAIKGIPGKTEYFLNIGYFTGFYWFDWRGVKKAPEESCH